MFADRLRDARKAKRYSQTEVSRMLGVTQQAVGKWRPAVPPRPQTVARLAEILDTPTDVLLGLRRPPGAAPAVGPQRLQPLYGALIPVVGTVRAGYGALAFEEDYGKEYASVKDPQNYFFLVVRATAWSRASRTATCRFVHRQSTLENGDLGVLVYGADGEGTLKKYIQRGNSVILHPFNPAYEELVIKGEELDHLYIAGKVVETKAKW